MAAITQNQALYPVVSLYQEVFQQDLYLKFGAVRVKKSKYLPRVIKQEGG